MWFLGHLFQRRSKVTSTSHTSCISFTVNFTLLHYQLSGWNTGVFFLFCRQFIEHSHHLSRKNTAVFPSCLVMQYFVVLPAFKILPKKSKILYSETPAFRKNPLTVLYLFLLFQICPERVWRRTTDHPASSFSFPKHSLPSWWSLLIASLMHGWWEQNGRMTDVRTLDLHIFLRSFDSYFIQCLWSSISKC